MSCPAGSGLCCQAKATPGPSCEVALLPAEAPVDLPAVAVDVVDRPRVARVDQQVAVLVEVDGVDVEVVVRRRGGGRHRRLALGHRHVVEAVPLEQHAARGDVDLLDHAVEDRPVRGAADRREVVRHLVVDRDQRRPLRRQHELVPVGVEAVPGVDGRDHVVVRVDDVVDALAVPDAGVARALPPREDGLAAVGLGAEVPDLVAGRERVEPDRPAAVVDDLGPLLRRARDVRLRRDEDVARLVLVAPLQHRDRRRLERRRVDERRSPVVVVACRRGRRRPGRDGGEDGGEERGEAGAMRAVHVTPRCSWPGAAFVY